MSLIDSVKISGFWGNHDVDLEFDPEVNFLVGRNGSGKTTAIEIIASALSCDEDALEKLSFSKVEITLFDRKTKRKPSISVERVFDDESPFSSIVYTIKDSAKAPAKEHRVFTPFEPMQRKSVSSSTNHYRYRFIKERLSGRSEVVGLRKEIFQLIKYNWLSINRVSNMKSNTDRGMRENLVDLKLREISDRLIRYFSELANEGSKKARDFQKDLFRSLVKINSINSLGEIVSDLDLGSERMALVDIFERFDIPTGDYSEDLEAFFSHLMGIQKEEDKSAYTHDDLVALINAIKIHSLVEDWNKAVQGEKETLKPRDVFVKIINEMFHRKEAEILPSGEFVFHTPSGKDLDVFELSSGEKQLFIILGEALLQKDEEWTYIADEPELSLHVDWQEAIVECLRALNPNSQVIFATHSPDIVGPFSDRVLNMEDAIR